MEKIINQIREEYGKLTYTYTAYFKMHDRNITISKWIKITQIALTAVSATGFLATVITNIIALSWAGGVTAVLSLFINIYTKDFRLLDDAKTYKDAADELWLIRQEYISLLTECTSMKIDDVIARRDALQLKTDSVNKRYPGTNSYGYKKARKALKENDEQFFSDAELDKMLPEELRTK